MRRTLTFTLAALGLAVGVSHAVEPDHLLADPLRTGSSAPHDAALVVGIESYSFLADVPFAQADAGAFEEFLLYTRGVPGDRVELMTTNPSKETIEASWARAAALIEPGGTLWLYFAGHGAADTAGRQVVLGVDTQTSAASFDSRSLTIAELQMVAEQSSAERIVLVLDACHVGRDREGVELRPDGARLAVSTRELHLGERTLLWSAASEGQVANAYGPASHGAFSLFAIGALRGWADGEVDGRPNREVTLGEAQTYVRRALREVGLGEQVPSLQGDAGWAASRSERALETGPALAQLPHFGEQGGGDERSETRRRLEELLRQGEARKEAERLAALADENALAAGRQRLLRDAKELWAFTEPVVALGGDECELALREFIAAFSDTQIDLPSGRSEVVTVPLLTTAEGLIAGCRGKAGASPNAAVLRAGDPLEARGAPKPEATRSPHLVVMVWLEPGTFWMGSPEDEAGRGSDEQRHQVTLSQGFWLGAMEVTQGQYRAVTGSYPSAARYKTVSLLGDDLPVQSVSWLDAVRFCNALSTAEGLRPAYVVAGNAVTWDRSSTGYRLPTEAEWEYAARAGTNTRWAGTDAEATLCRYGNVLDPAAARTVNLSGGAACDDGHAGAAGAGSFGANAWGPYDMTGNVWEWVWDPYDSKYPTGLTDPVVDNSQDSWRVNRGGSWGSTPTDARVANRDADSPSYRGIDLGFRVARSR